jgi:hypothetical protein
VVLGQRAIGEGGGGAGTTISEFDVAEGSTVPAAQPVSAAEANVNAAIERIERLQAFADDCKQRYNSDECAASYSAQQSQLDAVYLFVKEKMRGTQDFAQEGPNIDKCVDCCCSRASQLDPHPTPFMLSALVWQIFGSHVYSAGVKLAASTFGVAAGALLRALAAR